MPPNSTPAAAPPPPIAPQIPSALLRSTPSSTVVVMIDSVAGDTRAAPTPCTVRAAIITALKPASPHTSDGAVKTPAPVMKISLRPSRSAQRPPSSRKPPKVIVYAVITHCSPLAEKWSDREIDGSATVTIDTSRTVMKYATQTMVSTSQRRASGAVPPVPKAAWPSRLFGSVVAIAAPPSVIVEEFHRVIAHRIAGTRDVFAEQGRRGTCCEA